MNAVAKASGVINPHTGRVIPSSEVTRVRMRASLAMRDRGFAGPYDAGAMRGAEVGDWFPPLRSPDSETAYTNDLVRARSRDLVRNDGWATGSISRIADGMVGSNFHPVPSPNWKALAAVAGPTFDATWAAEFRSAVISEWRMWANDPLFYCDATRSMSMTQLFYLGARHKLIDGEALAMPLWIPERKGYGAARYATAVKLLDPDRLSNPFNVPDTHYLRGGVQVDDFLAPVAYYIRRAHQGDYYDAGMSLDWDCFDRQTSWGRPLVVHDLDRDRADQHRGLGILTPVLSRFRVLAKYDQVALQAAVMRTMVAFFIHSPLDPEQIALSMQLSENREDNTLKLSSYQTMRRTLGEDVFVGGARIPVLDPGSDVKSVQADGNADDFTAFEHTFLRSICAATGESAEEITKDYTHTNYSSARAAMLSTWRTMLRRRSNYVTGFCNPIFIAWLEEAIDEGYVPLPAGAPDFVSMRGAYGQCRWIGPGRGWIDPVKERQGEVLGLDAGFGTLDQTCGDVVGIFWMDIADERAVERAYIKASGGPVPDWQVNDPLSASLIDEKPLPQ